MPDVREYFDEQEEMIRAMWVGLQKHMWTCLPCKLVEDSDGHTCKLQPLIRGQVTDKSGNVTKVSHQMLDTVPVQWAKGGGHVMTFPLKKDDEVLAIFSSRNIDNWHQSGDVQDPQDDRMHSLSDAFCIPGVYSTPKKLNPAPSTTAAEMRSEDGQHIISLDKASGIKLQTTHAITHQAGNGMTFSLTGGVINIG